jgi:hypothetical protein
LAKGMERKPLIVGPFMVPLEGGVYGVWMASLFLGLSWVDRAPWFLTASWLAGALLALLLLERVRLLGDAKITVIPALLFIPLIIENIYTLLIVAAATILIAASLYTKNSLFKIVSGGALLSSHGPLYLAALGNLAAAVAGLAHESSAVAQAAIVAAKGKIKELYIIFYIFIISMVIGALALYMWGYSASAVILVGDALLRTLLINIKYTFKIKLKTYGFLETVHSSLMMLTIGLLTR